MPRTKSGNKRSKILDAAVELISSQGFQVTTIEQVAKKAKIATGTVYLYFQNKEDILIGIFERYITRYDQKLEAEFLGLNNPLSKLNHLIESDARTILEEPHVSKLFLYELRQSPTCLTFMKEKLITRYEHYLQDILSKHQLQPKVEVHLLAVVLSGILENLLYDWSIHQTEPDYAKLRVFMRGVLFHGLF